MLEETALREVGGPGRLREPSDHHAVCALSGREATTILAQALGCRGANVIVRGAPPLPKVDLPHSSPEQGAASEHGGQLHPPGGGFRVPSHATIAVMSLRICLIPVESTDLG